ncbi:MAG: bifunctional phosphopantothenoylcysteine decarboxylase/phosphopantothenate--cysteine ligase CoaBC [Candidatus Hydrogenedentota bacterium]
MSTKSASHVVLGVTGSIAAYKACEIASTLTKAGVNVTPVLTKSAQNLVGAATFEALTGNRVITDMFDPAQNTDIEHISVSTSADLFLVAPATANILGKAANGISDDWLSTALLVTEAPILFAPSMNTNMYRHVAVQANIQLLSERGNHFIGPGSGVLACKTVGPGRMSEPQEIVERVFVLLNGVQDLLGRHILITSGANHEPIDPVRYIGNRSSGKMGYAIADEALARGARVTVITGPADVAPPVAAEVIEVQTAQEMCNAVLEYMGDADVIIGAAAVADYRVAEPATQKMKRDGSAISLDLIENPDIIGTVGAKKRENQVVIGFAAETNDLIANAKKKLEKKKLDMIVANTVGTPESGFGSDTVDARFLYRDGTIQEQPMLLKTELAERLMDNVVQLLDQRGRVAS